MAPLTDDPPALPRFATVSLRGAAADPSRVTYTRMDGRNSVMAAHRPVECPMGVPEALILVGVVLVVVAVAALYVRLMKYLNSKA